MATVRCIGDCGKYFHPKCVELMAVKTYHQVDNECEGGVKEPMQAITCQNCITKIQKCMKCGEQGQCTISLGMSSMIRCAVSGCKNYFHKRCIEEASKDLPDDIKEQL